jgi:DNA-binding NarL/FixJ family response regulator
MNITDEQLNKIFELASIDRHGSLSDVTPSDITTALIEIERKIYSFSSELQEDVVENKKIIIADDLELSIYQLSTVLKKIGITPVVTRHKDEAIAEIQKIQFDCIIIDLFIPDSSDGFELIQSAVSKRTQTGVNSKIVVISGTDDTSLINRCYELGVDFCIQKDKDWHSKLLKYLNSIFKQDKSASFSSYVINNNTVSYVFKRFNDSKTFEQILRSINSSIFSGFKNILFDVKEISSFDVDNAYIFADIYKLCAENFGKFILVNPSIQIKEALSFAYLDGVITTVNSIEEANKLIKEASNPQ